jgi:hypothetical protein
MIYTYPTSCSFATQYSSSISKISHITNFFSSLFFNKGQTARRTRITCTNEFQLLISFTKYSSYDSLNVNIVFLLIELLL